MEKDDALRILVIEDDADARANLRDILNMDGHQSEMVATAAEALSRSEWPTYSAIILDWTLPDGTAEALLPRLRELSPQASVVVVTGTVGLRPCWNCTPASPAVFGATSARFDSGSSSSWPP